LFKTFLLHGSRVIQEDLVPIGPGATGQISYTWKGSNGFSTLLGVEQGATGHTIDSYMPHVVAGASFQQKKAAIRGVVAYDSNYEEFSGKVRVDVKASDAVSLWVMAGYGTDRHIAKSFYKPWGGNWAIWGGGAARFSPKLSGNLQLGYDENKNFSAVANLIYDVVPGFYIQPELSYIDNFDTSNSDAMGAWLRFRRSF
jgi:hypothetical protein